MSSSGSLGLIDLTDVDLSGSLCCPDLTNVDLASKSSLGIPDLTDVDLRGGIPTDLATRFHQVCIPSRLVDLGSSALSRQPGDCRKHPPCRVDDLDISRIENHVHPRRGRPRSLRQSELVEWHLVDLFSEPLVQVLAVLNRILHIPHFLNLLHFSINLNDLGRRSVLEGSFGWPHSDIRLLWFLLRPCSPVLLLLILRRCVASTFSHTYTL